MNIFLIISCGVFATGLVHSDQLYTDLAKFCSHNGMDFVSLTTTDQQPLLEKKAQKAYTGCLITKRSKVNGYEG